MYAICFAWPLFVTLFIVYLFENEKIVALSFELYHRDSYDSPIYEPNLSEEEIIQRGIVRSVNISNIITQNRPMSKVSGEHGQYIMKIHLGTPPVEIFGLVDTGSEFTWIECKPYALSFPQKLPLFNPVASSTYARVSCGFNKPCPPGSRSICEDDGFCHYNIRYTDGSYSKGILSKETMRMESTSAHDVFELPHYTFGCGTDNLRANNFASISGIIGLGVGPLSFMSQLGSRGMQRFSYCFVPASSPNVVSHIRFGAVADVHLPGSVTLSLVNKSPHNLYFLTLEAFTVGKIRVEFADLSETLEEGNISINSGTISVFLPMEFYTRVKNAVIQQTNARPVPNPYGPQEMCFKNKYSLKLPEIVANFKGGDIALKQHNVFRSVDMGSYKCFRFQGSDRRKHVTYGTSAQENYIIGYDIVAGTISFKAYGCDKY